MRRTAIYTLLTTNVMSSCGPIEPTELEPMTSQDSGYVFTKKQKQSNHGRRKGNIGT